MNRLLVGSDISVLRAPTELIHRVATLENDQTPAWYAVDRLSFGMKLYRMTAWPGPQCPGLLGDFMYLSAGIHVTIDNILSKMLWYLQQPIDLNRTDPPSQTLMKVAKGHHAV